MFDVIEIIVHGEHNYSQLELTKSDSQVDVDIFSILKNHLLWKISRIWLSKKKRKYL